ncbi:hypothetical protein [Haloferula rosea]|uniref:Verru_Chthon cassette protein A n=1 Tax=Haloferula rosea TaxID=490093 RepID=A0A934VEH0_9BACT|nr:hypothetical protein [Haloferula rosea]MBK1825515.1 hypothetical protein [Haloferula rosea]
MLKPTKPIKRGSRAQGFALLVTISLLVLLTLLAVGLLSLSSVALRGSNAESNKRIAQANAKLSLQLALSRLQLLAGTDTRVTAPASAVNGVNGPEHLHGVWRSWEGTDHDEDSGLPISPNYGSKVDDSGDGKFLGWLVSGEQADSGASAPPTLVEGANTIPLVSEGTLGAGSDKEVHLAPTELESGGAIAWWVSGENTKARLKVPDEPSGDFEATDQLLVSPGPSGSAFNIEDHSKLGKAITRKSMNFLSDTGTDKPSQFFHDLTPHSRGLLTNVANGGWRRDLSIWAENWDEVEEGFSSFTLSPGKVHTSGKFNRSSGSNPIIYPWTNWNRSPFQNSVSWAALADFATQYKQLDSSGNPVAVLADSTSQQLNDSFQQWELTDTVRRMPVVARVHTVFSLSAKDLGNGNYQPCVVVNPVLTMWNPYDVALDTGSSLGTMRLTVTMASPFSIRFELNDKEQVRSLESIGVKSMNIPVRSPSAVWLPGEVRTFSPTGGETVEDESNVLVYDPGCNPGGGVKYNIPGLENRPGTETLSATEALLQAIHNGPNVQGTGVYYTLKRASSRIARPPNTANKSCLLDDLPNAQRMLGENLKLTGVSGSLQSLSTNPKPFLTVAFSARYARDVNDQMADIIVNGIHNMNPVVGYMVSANGDQNATPLVERFDPYPFNVMLFRVNGYTDPGMPSGISLDPEGYLGSGFSSGDGLSNLALLEVPTRPLRTIGDLQHFNVNKCNHWPPYTLNALGNSRTSPFIDSDKIRVSQLGGGDPVSNTVGHDHSYAFNHVMHDDWFVSSIAPDTRAWSASHERSMQAVYEDHLTDEVPLPNHYYKPATPLSESEAASKASDFLGQSDAWEKVAAELEVEGMFNINSTSELAWEMLLKRHFGSGNAGMLILNGNNADLEEGKGSPFPRTTLGSDPSAAPGAFSLLSQQQRFTDDQIKALAREIVVEIKKRGPFLSLSEFYNRQLSNDTELAKAGAVESALQRLSEGPSSENPYAELQSSFSSAPSSTDVIGGRLTYPFPEAAEGNPAYGFPGWTRQADILRPLSGILSARDDTFTIRAYGDARDPATNKVVSRAWCEAVVQRKADYVDSSAETGDEKYVLPSETTLNSKANQRFGRGFEIIHFRWLSPEEI